MKELLQIMIPKPELLTDPSRLQEIYDLRVDVWERSGKSDIVNRRLFPKGWSDPLDDTALHWVINDSSNKIIAAARLNVFQNTGEFPYHASIKHLALPHAMPFAFYSRLVIHPEYRGMGLSSQLAISRMLFCEEKEIRWMQVFITNEHILHLFERLNCRIVGQAEVSYHKSSQPHFVNVLIKEYDISQPEPGFTG